DSTDPVVPAGVGGVARCIVATASGGSREGFAVPGGARLVGRRATDTAVLQRLRQCLVLGDLSVVDGLVGRLSHAPQQGLHPGDPGETGTHTAQSRAVATPCTGGRCRRCGPGTDYCAP